MSPEKSILLIRWWTVSPPFGGNATLRMHILHQQVEVSERRAIQMLTIEGLIAVISLCIGCFSLGYVFGCNDSNKTQK